MPPRRLKKKSVKRLVKKRVAKAIEEYEKSRANLDSTGSSGGNTRNARGTVNVQGCSHKTFMNGKPHSFNGTEGVVGLRRWIEKVEQVFETCKCAEEDKVMFAASTFEGRALTWWNGNVHTLGLVNANRIPWTEFKTMMTTEYCPATEIQRMEQELWTLTLKGDDIEAYNNRFHELALMCPELVPTEKKKIERYVRGFPERIKGNITSSKPATLHDAINMARELVEQAVQGRATRIGESNKRKWEDHQRNTNNNNPNNNNNRNRNNNYHQQQNRRQETARAYAASSAECRGYAGNLPKYIRWNLPKIVRAILQVIIPRDCHRLSIIDCPYSSLNDEFLVVQGQRPEKNTGSLASLTYCARDREFRIDLFYSPLPRIDDLLDIYKVLLFLEDRSSMGISSVDESGRKDITRRGKAQCFCAFRVADALSRKERLKPRRVRAMSITIHSGLKTKILEAQGEASKDLKAPAEWLKGIRNTL
ncbi:putative reverse transcriptase domain-containing protein [Tanacetum coccineum]